MTLAFIPGGDLVIGLFIQVLVALVVWAFRLIRRALRSAVFEHPLLTLFVLKAVDELWWFVLISPGAAVWLRVWYPRLALGLALVAIAKFVGEGGPATASHNVRRASRVLRDLALWSALRERNEERRERIRIRNLPHPPLAAGTDQRVIDVRETAIPLGPVQEVTA